MKHFMLRSLMLFSLLCSTWGVGSVWAQLTKLEVGGVYHFVNANYTEKAMGATNPRSVAGVAADDDNKAQLWYVESKNEHGYALRNLGFGTYLQANGQSSRWTLASTTNADNSWITLEKVGSNNAFKGYTFSDYGYAHIDGGSNVVGWTSSATSTQWTITEIGMTQPEIQEALDIFTSVPTIQANLDNLFSDKSCTTLKGKFDENNASYQALPTTLQAMVRKVAGHTSWEEANSDNSKAKWDADYAKKYRIQMYEPYCDPEKASAALALNQHSNMNNPTGLFANSKDVIYVMVEGEIKEGATLYLSYYTQHGKLGSATDGYELKQGLNVLPIYQDECNLYINYVVETFEKSDNTRGHLAKKHKLSEFPALKIHIEGGHINGYYNKMGDNLYPADKNADWDYLEARAPQKDLVILGQYMTLNFPLNDADTEGNKGMRHYLNDLVKVEDVINAWDNVMLWERMLLGVAGKTAVDAHSPKSPYSKSDHVIAYTGEDASFPTGYDDYYNIHGLAQGVGGKTYMYGSGDHSGYHYNTMGGIIQNLPTTAGNHWGPAHEIGHQHQNLINMRGEMEVSNNLFSNVVLWMYGETTSRVNGTEGSLDNILKNFNKETGHYLNNSIWGMTQMYYKLFLYYHVLGHNPKFYPRLFEMLRQDPQRNNRAGQVDGANAQLHLYKKMCAAAEEDLTEFFRAHGFFKPLTNWSIDDYGVSNYNMTQSQIDEAIAEVKSNEWKENIAVLFINDATGETIKSHKGDDLELYGETTVCAEVGGYGNFNNEAADYAYTISGTTVTMEGTGGVGFAIFNNNGEIIGFSVKKTFEISAETAKALASGQATVVALNADNTSVDAPNLMESGDNQTKYNLLGSLLGNVKATLALSDETGTKVGFYRKEALTDLQTAYNAAKTVHDEKTVDAYTPVYDVLFSEYSSLINNEYARINITEGYAYRLTNKAYSDRSMGVETAKGDDENEMFGLPTAETDAQIWYFEPGTTAGTYYLKNKGTKLYPAGASSGAVLKADKAESTKGQNGGAAPYTLHDMGNGVFALSNGSGLHCASSQSYNIVGWGTDADATQWYITAVELDNALEARLKLEETIEKTMSLINEMASAIPPQNLKLQTEDNRADYYLSTNACYNTLNNASDGQGLAGLLDDDIETYFHSDYNNQVQDTHYLQVDLGEGKAVSSFKFYYTIRSNNNNYPKEIKVEGSANGADFYEFKTFTEDTDHLPTSKDVKWESELIENPNHYRFLRFSVTKAWDNKKYFVMSTFGISIPEPIVNEVYSEFANDKESKEALKTQIIAALNELVKAQQLVDEASADEADYNTQRDALNEHYETLLTNYYNKAKNAALDAKKAELQELINDANALIAECGEVTYTPAMFDGEAPLQVTDANGKFYLSTNAQSNQEGPISGLIDGVVGDANSNTYFHTDYDGDNSSDGLDHYIQVKLGEKVKAFQFTYTNRHNTDKNYATKMTIWGSTDGTNFEEITRIENLPTSKSAVYTSEPIYVSKEYTDLRFMVTESTSTKKGGHYFFHMAEFDLIIGKPESYTAQMNQNIGDVTEDLLITTYKENEEAKSTFNYATTELQVINAIADLQAQYDALEAAKNVVDKEPLIQLIATATEKLAACGTVTPNDKELDVEFKEETAGSVNKNMLRELYRAIKTAEGVRDNANATQEEVNAASETLTSLIGIVETAQQSENKAYLKSEIAAMEKLLDDCEDYSDSDIQELIAECNTALQTAKNVYDADDTTVEEYSLATTNLTALFTDLSVAKAKADLRTEISELEELINKCLIIGTTIVTTEEDCDLQASSSNAAFYISTNAQTNESGIANLVDDDKDSFFQTKSGVGEAQYLLIDAGADKTFKKFKFSYQTCNNPMPYAIEVYGSNNNDDFKKLAIFTKDDAQNPLPSSTNLDWTSSEISNGTAYRYLRFNVTKSGVVLKINDNKEIITDEGQQLSNKYKNGLSATDAATSQSEYCFAMSEFDLINIVDEEQPTEILAGTVTDEQLKEATSANTAAEELANTSAVKAELEAKTAELQGIYEALYAAYGIQVSLATTVENKDKLLSNIEYGKTIGTFSAPYATVIPEGVTAYYAQQKYDRGTVSLTPIEDAKALPANQGVILIGEVGVNSVTFYPATNETPADLSTNTFSHSATSSVVMESNDYILANGGQGIGFYQATPSSTLKQGKAYFRLSAGEPPLSLVLKFGDNTTDIDAVTTVTPSSDELIYDIYGRRVTEVKKGNIYIKNGKKFFVK